MNRRDFLKTVGASTVTIVATTEVAGMIAGTPSVSSLLLGLNNSPEDVSKDAALGNNDAFDEIKKSALEKLVNNDVDIIDHMGSGLFIYGVKSLLDGDSLGNTHYLPLIRLLTARYDSLDKEGRKHLKNELIESTKSLGVLLGLVAIGEGVNVNIIEAYQIEKQKKPDTKDQVALLTLFSSSISPLITTVGNATIVKNMANELAKGDKDIIHHFIGHNSGRSGYLLFGDPPFIALANKYGFKEAVLWQFTNMLPLAIYSLISTTFKVNLKILENQGITGLDARKQALKDTIDGIKGNIGFLTKMIGVSLKNIGQYLLGQNQDIRGLNFNIGNIISDKIENAIKLFYSNEFDNSYIEDREGITHSKEEQIRIKAIDQIYESILIDNNINTNDITNAHQIKTILESGDKEQIDSMFKTLGIENIDNGYLKTISIINSIISKETPTEQINASKRVFIDNFLKVLKSPSKAYTNVFDAHRISEAFGHNAKDIINVFPFQAGCIPFLKNEFTNILNNIEKEGLGEKGKEATLFLLITIFSMFADNYVACKIGIDIMPEKPEISLIGAIEGGQLTSIGNMANMAQFSSDDYSLADSLKRIHLSLDNVAVGFIYSQILGFIKGLGLDKSDNPIAKLIFKQLSFANPPVAK